MKRFGALIAAGMFFLSSSYASAASFSLSSDQATISSSEEFNVNVNFNISSADGTSYYLRGVFFKDGTSNYCGYTWNGNNWYNGPFANGGWNQLFPVTIYQSSWSGQLKAKLDPNDSGCQTSGIYDFKIQRYTTGGSASFDTQNTLVVTVTVPTATPTPVPTNTPTPTPTNSPTPTPHISPIITYEPLEINGTSSGEKINGNGKVLGVSGGNSITPIPTPTPGETLVMGMDSPSPFFSPAFFMIGGLSVITAGCSILLFREWKKQKEGEI